MSAVPDWVDRIHPGARQEARVQLIPFEGITLGTERRYLVKGLIPREGLTLVWGPPKCGKSFWIFDLMMHIALGWDYRGRRVQAGPVVYCAFEGQSGLKARVEAFRQRFLAEDHDPVPFYLQPVTLDLVADHGELIEAIRQQVGERPVAVVLDTLNRSLAGSESRDEDMAAYIRAADAIREAFSCAVIVVHHCGVEGTRPRGHTSLTGAADAQIAVSRDAADNIIVKVELAKDGPQGDEIFSRLEMVEVGMDEDDEPITSCIVVPVEGVASGRAEKVTGATKQALTMLRTAIEEKGESSPGGERFPTGCRTVPVSTWRRYCETGMITTSENPDTRRKTFDRAAAKLKSLGLIGLWADHVWLA